VVIKIVAFATPLLEALAVFGTAAIKKIKAWLLGVGYFFYCNAVLAI
jgi:hypothetical protein